MTTYIPISIKKLIIVVSFLVGTIEIIRYQIAALLLENEGWFQPYYLAIITGVILAVGNYLILSVLIKKYIEQQVRLKQTQSLYKLGVEMGSFKDVNSNMELAVEHSKKLINCDFAGLVIYSQRKQEMTWKHVSGNLTEKHKKIRMTRGEGITGLCIEKKSTIHVEEYPGKIPIANPDASPIMKIEKLVSAICVPITYEEQIFGALFLAQRKKYTFSENEVFVLHGVAHQLGVLLEHSRLYQEIESLATVAERERLAREIHDGVAQTISYVQIQIKKLKKAIVRSEDKNLNVILDEIDTAVEQSYTEVRQSINGLKDKELFSKGFEHWLYAHADNFKQQFSIDVDVEFLDQTTKELSESAKIQLGRIIQEALTNIRKHAEATLVKISVGRENDKLQVEISDNGVGFECNGSPDGHYGLSIMQERSSAIGGNVNILSTIGQGTKVTVNIPYEENERREFSWIQ